MIDRQMIEAQIDGVLARFANADYDRNLESGVYWALADWYKHDDLSQRYPDSEFGLVADHFTADDWRRLIAGLTAICGAAVREWAINSPHLNGNERRQLEEDAA